MTLLLDQNLDLLRGMDVRGATPLKYVSEDNWLQWCAYLFHQKVCYFCPPVVSLPFFVFVDRHPWKTCSPYRYILE